MMLVRDFPRNRWNDDTVDHHSSTESAHFWSGQQNPNHHEKKEGYRFGIAKTKLSSIACSFRRRLNCLLGETMGKSGRPWPHVFSV